MIAPDIQLSEGNGGSQRDQPPDISTAISQLAMPITHTEAPTMIIAAGAAHAAEAVPTPAKPIPLAVNFAGIPQSFHALRLFVLWRYMEKGSKWSKVPFQPNGVPARTNDAATFATLEMVRHAYERGGFDGIGIVLREGLCGIDLDHVICANGEIEPWAAEILHRFSGTYIERSPGGDGFHIICGGAAAVCGKQGPGNRLEVYDESSARYFTLTGHRYGN